MEYEIRYGLGGGFGGCENCEWETITADSEDDAEEAAYDMACEHYELFAGMHGLRSIDQIMEEDSVDEEEAGEIYDNERETWLVYEVRQKKDASPVKNQVIEKIKEEIEKLGVDKHPGTDGVYDMFVNMSPEELTEFANKLKISERTLLIYVGEILAKEEVSNDN